MKRTWLKRICQTAAAFTAVIIIFTAAVAPILPAAAAEEDAAETSPEMIQESGGEALGGSLPADEGLGEEEPEEPAEPESPVSEEEPEDDRGEAAPSYRSGPVEYAKKGDYTVTAELTEDAEIPADAAFAVSELTGREYDEYYAKALAALGGEELSYARFFDIHFELDGKEIEPAVPIRISISYAKPVRLASDDELQALHFDGKKDVKVLDAENVGKDGAADQIEEVTFETESFSVFGIVEKELTAEVTLPGSDDTYEASVTYGPEAGIPENVHLEVTALDGNGPEWKKAKEAVVGAMKAADRNPEESSFGFAALDISIVDDETGEKVEPTEGSKVRVTFKVKKLPKGAKEDDLAKTLEIRHLHELDGKTVVETVAEAADVTVAGGKAEAAFTVGGFSTFTLTWSSVGNMPDTTTNIRWRLNNQNTRGNVIVRYVDPEGNGITRPDGIGGNYDIPVTQTTNGEFTDRLVFSADNVAKEIDGLAYQSAYILLNGVKTEVTEVVASITIVNRRSVYATQYYNGDVLVGTYSANNTNNYTRPDVYLQYDIKPKDIRTTIHFGYMEDGQFVEFEDVPSPAFESAERAYLIYDFSGYHYEGHTYYSTEETSNPAGATRVQAMLQKTENGGWQYHNYSTSFNENSGWNYIASDSHFYVLYKRDPAVAPGGTPTVKPVNPGEEPEAPELTKNSLNNGDGTNTISLGITGKTVDLEVMKLADVIVVFDASNSMKYGLNTSSNVQETSQRLYFAKNAARTLAENLLAKVNSSGDKLVRMHLISFNASAKYELTDFTEDYDTFATAVGGSAAGTGGGITTAQGTNWESALMLANSLSVDSGRATFVIFITDGEPTARISRMGLTDQEIITAGTNNGRYTDSDIFFATSAANRQPHYNAALAEAKAIVNAGKNFYSIGISRDVSSLNQFTVDAGAGEGHCYTADNEQGLEDAFNQIEAEITALLGAGDVQITDGITALTNLKAKVLETVDPSSFRYYRYGGWKTSTVNGGQVQTKDKYGADYEHRTEWTTREAEGCGAAAYDASDGSVKWNMGTGFQLEDDVTYVVEFRAWPSQAAYDLVANLNNGTKVYAAGHENSISAEEREQIREISAPAFDSEGNCTSPGNYTLKTNTDDGLGATYKLSTKSGAAVSYADDAAVQQVTIGEGKLENMSLMSERMSIRKSWAHETNDSHAGDQVKFFLTVEDEGYYQNDGSVSKTDENALTMVLGEPDWEDFVYIAPGMMDYADGEANVLEPGHEYGLYEYEIKQEGETDNFIASYDFISETVRPMRVNGDLKVLVRYNDAGEIPSGVTETYTIDGKTYYVRAGSGENGVLSGTNYRRAELDITKIIKKGMSSLTEEQLNKEVFTYRVTLRMPADVSLALITGWQFVYRPDNPNWTIAGYQEEDEPLAGDEERFLGENFRWGTFTYNGTKIGDAVVPDEDPDYVRIVMDLSMYPNQVVRLTNLPLGTEYTIEEVYANYRTLSSVGLMSDSTVVPASAASNLSAQGYANVTSVSRYGTADGRVISGTIDKPNRRYYNQFTNTLGSVAAADLQVTKHLEGYAWSGERYYFTLEAGEAAGTVPMPNSRSLYLSNDSGNADRSYGFGSVRFLEEGTYTYIVREARYRAGGSTDIVDISDNAATIPGTKIVYDKPVTITVTVSKDQDGILRVEKVDGERTELSGTVINVTFTNRQPCLVRILKVGNSETPLAGVSFAVYSDAELTSPVTVDASGQAIGTDGVITTDENGFAELGAMLSGTVYYLSETGTQLGYIPLFEPVKVAYDGTTVTSACEQEDAVSEGPEWIYQDEDGAWVVKINNIAGVTLPNTGGPGRALYLASGLMLILASASVLVIRMRRKRED